MISLYYRVLIYYLSIFDLGEVYSCKKLSSMLKKDEQGSSCFTEAALMGVEINTLNDFLFVPVSVWCYSFYTRVKLAYKVFFFAFL